MNPMQYSVKCPLCSQNLMIDAESDEAALEVILKEAKAHMETHHPFVGAMPDDQMKAMIRIGMKREK